MHDHQIVSRTRPDKARPDKTRPDKTRPDKARPDNKVRLSQDVLEKADRIAAEWGLKNARAAVEAVFRCYCDDYLQGRSPGADSAMSRAASSAYLGREDNLPPYGEAQFAAAKRSASPAPKCEALDALDQLLAL